MEWGAHPPIVQESLGGQRTIRAACARARVAQCAFACARGGRICRKGTASRPSQPNQPPSLTAVKSKRHHRRRVRARKDRASVRPHLVEGIHR